MNTNADKLSVIKHKCEKDHLFFVRYFFKQRMGDKFVTNWHHHYIAYEIDRLIKRAQEGKPTQNIIFNLPPGGSKTEMAMNIIPRGLALNPRSRFLYLSFSDTLVTDVSSTARTIVKSKPYQQLWPVAISSDTDAKGSWKTDIEGFEGGHIYAASMGGQVTGRRAGRLTNDFNGLIVLDDPLKPEDAFSDTKRKAANRKLINTVKSRKAKSDTPIILIMQRLHSDDPTQFILDGNMGGEWRHIEIPALIDDDFIATLPGPIAKLVPTGERDSKGRQSYWPAKESLQSMLELESGGNDKDGQKVSRYTFNSQYMQKPTKLGGGLISADNFGRYSELPKLKWLAIFADTAQKIKEHNDYSVFMCAGEDYSGNLVVVDLLRGKWEAPDLEKKAEAFINKHNDNPDMPKLRYVAIEDKASGTGLIQGLRRKTKVSVKAIQRNTDKLTRFMDAHPYIEDGIVYLPLNAHWVGDFIDEAEEFAADMSHAHDDQIDVLVDLINIGRQRQQSYAWAGKRTY
ncbi:phage terminase large subunit [Psychrobacter sanguinis]|uniref:phage terminase large subunit n=1 Tax=Psychrobacter sanguinis TaxID=861445 RepID=UPI00191A1E6A|nr:phage terminase large subunit [Psychrobacter sanguinis]MCC3344876.1 phage terminase large subunit [Psychrobacter sanguinis]